MRRLFLVFVYAVVGSIAGCSWYDVVFNAFGDNYSGDGTTRYEKRQDYESRIESWGAIHKPRMKKPPDGSTQTI